MVLTRAARLGLDLRGGTQIDLEAQDTELEQVDDDTMDRTLEVLRRRVDQLGVPHQQWAKRAPATRPEVATTDGPKHERLKKPAARPRVGSSKEEEEGT